MRYVPGRCAVIEYGIWSHAAGGIIADGYYTITEAADAAVVLVNKGEDSADLAVVPVCELHPDYPADACHECEDDDQ
jgi:hypothetical protein